MMLKKVLMMVALTLMAVGGSVQAHAPVPTCDPCPMVR
jgi:hypothetical protein